MHRPTADHGEIVAWALRHSAVPAEIVPLIFDSAPSRLHFLFGTRHDLTPEIRPISWEEFFSKFDLLNLRMSFDESPMFELFQDEQASLYRNSRGQA